MQSNGYKSDKLILLLCLFTFLAYLFYRVIFVYYLNPGAAGVDNNVVYFIQQVLDGEQLYTDPSQPPFAVAQYGPLYYYLAAGVSRLCGAGAGDVLTLFGVSRWLSLVLNVLLALFLARAGRKIFQFSSAQSWFLGLLTFIFIERNSFGRPDSLEHLFFFISLFWFLRAIQQAENSKPRYKEFIIAGMMAALAILSKQSAITLPVISMLWFLIQKKWAGAVPYFLSLLLTSTVVLLPLTIQSGFRPVYQNMVLGLDNGISLTNYWNYFILFFYSWYGCLWVFCFLVIYFLLRREKQNIFRFLAMALVVQFVLTNLFALKQGSTSAYFTNWWTMLFIGILYYWPAFSKLTGGIHPLLSRLILSFFLVLKIALIAQPVVEIIRTSAQRRIFYEQEKELTGLLLRLPGSGDRNMIFCNLFSPDSYLNNFLYRQAIVPQYDVVTQAAYPRNVYDYSLLRTWLQDGSVKYIVSKKPGAPLQFMGQPLPGYAILKTIGDYTVYQYAGNTGDPAAAGGQ